MKAIRLLVAFAAAALLAPGALAERPEKLDGAYYVAFKDGVNARNNALLRAHGAAAREEWPELKVVEVALSNPVALAALAKNPNVEYVEEVPMRYKLDLASQQATPSLANGLYGLVTTKAVNAHAAGYTGTGIKVGVADTQLDVSHVDIAGNLLASTDCVGKNPCSGSGWQNDGETHATHVAGTILGVNNSAGVLGVAYGAKLLHSRVLGPSGGTTSDIMRGVTWLKDQGARIVNLSLGGGLKSRTEETFYKNLRAAGVLVVAATGNDGRTTISYPAAYAVNVSIGAVDVNNAHASFSNTGKGIDLSAPGVMVLSSVPAGTGSEAAVSTSSAYRAFGMEFAGKTNGLTDNLVDCGIGNPGECGGAAAGFVALVQRGTLSFADKVTNVAAQGAVAAIIYNNVAGDYSGTLGAAGSWIPAVAVSDVTGAALKGQIGAATTVLNQASAWDHYDGTSMATPHAAGVAALLWAAKPSLTADGVESTLKSTCVDLGAAGYDTTFGYGLVDARAALRAAGFTVP
jgi:subtilisin family serine protease